MIYTDVTPSGFSVRQSGLYGHWIDTLLWSVGDNVGLILNIITLALHLLHFISEVITDLRQCWTQLKPAS